MSTMATITVSIVPAETAFFRSANERLPGMPPPTRSHAYAFFHEYTERVRLVIAERLAFQKSGATIKRQRIGIVDAGLQPQQRQAGAARYSLQLRQHPLADPAATPLQPHIHAFDLAPATRVAQNRSAADRLVTLTYDQKRHRRIGQR